MATSTTKAKADTKPAEETAPEVKESPGPEKSESKQYVRYFPPTYFGERVIDEAAWKSIGVDDQKEVVWNEGNDFRLPIERFSEAALDYIDSDKEDGLEIVDE